jgi:hypothetical protein
MPAESGNFQQGIRSNEKNIECRRADTADFLFAATGTTARCGRVIGKINHRAIESIGA